MIKKKTDLIVYFCCTGSTHACSIFCQSLCRCMELVSFRFSGSRNFTFRSSFLRAPGAQFRKIAFLKTHYFNDHFIGTCSDLDRTGSRNFRRSFRRELILRLIISKNY